MVKIVLRAWPADAEQGHTAFPYAGAPTLPALWLNFLHTMNPSSCGPMAGAEERAARLCAALRGCAQICAAEGRTAFPYAGAPALPALPPRSLHMMKASSSAPMAPSGNCAPVQHFPLQPCHQF